MSDRARPRKRKFVAECRDGVRTTERVIKRFPAMAASEVMKLNTAFMTSAMSAPGSKRNGICIAHDLLSLLLASAILLDNFSGLSMKSKIDQK